MPKPQVSHLRGHALCSHITQLLPTLATLRGGRGNSWPSGQGRDQDQPGASESRARDSPRPSPRLLPRASSTRCQPRHVTFTRPRRCPCGRLFPAAILPRTCHSRSRRRETPRKAVTRFCRLHTRFERALRLAGLGRTSNNTSHPGRREKALGTPQPAIGWSTHVTPAPPPSQSPYPRKHPRQALNTSRQVHATGRAGTNGARGEKGACAYLPGRAVASPRAARLPGRESSRCRAAGLVIGCQAWSRAARGPAPPR